MPDLFSRHSRGLESPATDGFSIVPDDANVLDQPPRALNVATSGTLRVETLDGSDVTLFLAAGSAFPLRVRRVFATGTSASGIVGLV